MKQLNKPYLLEIINCLAENKVEFIICGGMDIAALKKIIEQEKRGRG